MVASFFHVREAQRKKQGSFSGQVPVVFLKLVLKRF